jgi:hypothetical protein
MRVQLSAQLLAGATLLGKIGGQQELRAGIGLLPLGKHVGDDVGVAVSRPQEELFPQRPEVLG